MQIKVNGKFYNYFNDVSISTNLDAVASTFAFRGLYDPTNPTHRELFKPLSYAKVEFFDGEQLLSTGRITNWAPDSTSITNLYALAGYSLPGVLEDCNIPFVQYPTVSGGDGIQVVSLESHGLSLEQIIRKLIKPFGLNFIVYDSVAKECAQIIPKAVGRPEEKIKDYICKIANQKNIVISHDIHGNLIAFRPDAKAAPRLSLNPQNTLSMQPVIDGQGMHSHITCIRQPTKGDGSDPFSATNEGESFDGGGDSTDKKLKVSSMDTVLNPLVGVFRPLVDVLSSGTFYDTHRAALNRRSAELKNIKVNFSLDHWEKVSVGDIVEIVDSEIFLDNKVRMVLESTVISESADRKTMTGTLVMPETFTGDTPVNIFA